RRPIEAHLHRAEGADVGPLALRDGPDGRIVLGRGDLQAGVNAVLDFLQVVRGFVQALQRDKRGGVCVDAERHLTVSSPPPVARPSASRTAKSKRRYADVVSRWLTRN